MNTVFRFAVDHPVWTIGIVVVFALALLVPLKDLKQETDWREFLSDDDPIIQLMDQAEERYGRTLGIMVMLLNDGGLFNEESLDRIDRLAKAFEDVPGVYGVTTPLNSQVITGTEDELSVSFAAPGGDVPRTPEDLETFRQRLTGSRMLEGNVISSDGKAASINIELELGADEYEITERIIEIVEPFNGGQDEIYIYGDAYFDAVVSEEMETDLTVLFPLALGLMVIVLFLSFLNARGVLIPIVIVLLSVFVAVGFMGLAGFPMTMVSFIAPVLLLAIGIADGIHVLNRYNEEIGKGVERRQAVLTTMEEMKGPVVMTSLTTAVGFLSLLSSFFLPQKQFGVVTAVGVLAAMVFSLVFIPAVLSLLKPPRVRNVEKGFRPLTRVLMGFERTVARRRRLVLVFAVGVLGVMIGGIPMLRIETSNEEFLGKDHPAIQILNKVDEHFSGAMQIMIEVDTHTSAGLMEPAVLSQILELEEYLRANDVGKTISLTDLVREMNQKFHSEDPAFYRIPEDRRAVAGLMNMFRSGGGTLGDMATGNVSAGTIMGLYPMKSTGDISRLSRTVQAYLDERFANSDLTVRMVGATILMDRLMTRMNQSQMIGLGTTMVAVAILVSLLMGSIVAGLIAIIPLILTVAMSMGIMAYTGTPLDMMTLMVSAIAVGIGVDYSIHFISRFRREYRTHQNGEQALQTTIRTTGRGITYNALTVALGFFILVFASFKGIRSFGLLIALTMAVSALSAISIIPAILVEWKPGFLTRVPWSKTKQAEDGREHSRDTS
jgi:hydrophobe/amphiphile efflux-3 (HAE3) family protein